MVKEVLSGEGGGLPQTKIIQAAEGGLEKIKDFRMGRGGPPRPK